MRKIFLLGVILGFTSLTFAQKDNKTLATINKEKITVAEFKRMYEKNLDVIDNEEGLDVEKNLDLFINYKLKVKQAYEQKLDTLESYIREIDDFKEQLSSPYLQDTSFVNSLVKEAYHRTKYQIKAKHILIKLSPNAPPKDTLTAFTKITKIRDRILKGEKFEAVAKETSDDPSAVRNGGDLGYFDAFTMIYSFEDATYNTKVGDVSAPFRTQFGYHFVQVDNKKESKGEVDVAHILVADSSKVGKAKIDEAYAKLLKGETFEAVAKEYSDDTGSKQNAGRLGKMKSGKRVKPFDDAIFSLKKVNDFSKPFETIFGFHIVKLHKKHPIQPFAELKDLLTQKVKNGDRNKLTRKVIVAKLRKKYTVLESTKNKTILTRKDILKIPKDSLQNVLFSIDGKETKQIDFVEYIKFINGRSTVSLYADYLENAIALYYKNDLVNKEPSYANTLKEYEDGLLLFELMQQNIWGKSVKDTIGLNTYFENHINDYEEKELKKVKGKVMNDYQMYLENKWIADLRKENKVVIKKKILKKLLKYYEKRK